MVLLKKNSAEEIVVPDNFPNILKTYVKDVIRTQPYDVLRWSATYFRCIANQVQPPVKTRLELESIHNNGRLTRGFLKILVKQLGKGFYVSRDVLQGHWEGLCLAEEELWKYLSICRMLHWEQIQWLKVFAVMAGSLTQDFRSTIELLCELLTDELEGGPNPIPVWMFGVCYMFIAEIDCSDTQEFKNGRKLLKNGELEPETDPHQDPISISTVSFRETIANEWKECAEYKMATKYTKEKIIQELDEPQLSPRLTNNRLSSDYKFGNYCDAIKQSFDFESIISILSDIGGRQMQRCHSLTNLHGGKSVSSTNGVLSEEISREQNSVLREIGAPWSWMHQFALQNSVSKSYNFVEKTDEELANNENVDADEPNEEDSIIVHGKSTGFKAKENICDFSCVVEPMPGIGGHISSETTQQFLAYLKHRSKDENGMVFPRHFKEENCPNMVDN